MPIVDDVMDAANKAAQKAKLNAEILIMNRKIINRMNQFGVELYTHVAPMTESQEFYANDHDKLVQVLRPPLLNCSKEVAALQNRVESLSSQLEEAKVRRAAAFPVPAETAAEKLKNAGKATGMAANEARLKTELAVVQRQILGHHEAFGRALYPNLANLEDTQGWLPTDRDVRSIYDQARREIDVMYKSRKEKLDLLLSLGGNEMGLGIHSAPTSRRPSLEGTDAAFGSSSLATFSPPKLATKAGDRMRRSVSTKENSSNENTQDQHVWSDFAGTRAHSTGSFASDFLS